MNDRPTPFVPSESEQEAAENARRARAIIKQDIEELGQRLKPDKLKANAKENLKTGAKEAWQSAKGQAMNAISGTSRRAADSIAGNGGPLLLMGLGAGWLAWSLRKQREAEHWYEVPSGGPSIAERAHELGERASDSAQRHE